MTSPLEALAARVEAATGADRELDAEIVCAIDRRPDWLSRSEGRMWVDRSGTYIVVRWQDAGMPQSSGNPSVDEIPSYTSSLDAALTLVPEGYVVTVADWWCYDGADQRAAHFADCAKRSELEDGDENSIQQAWANSKALALTAAALRARAALQGEGR